ncbi:MAG: hypothetical protein ACRCY4_10035 [Brevinema sp.]
MKVQVFFLLVGAIFAPLYSQDLPPLVSVPQADSVAPQLDIPQIEEIKPIVVTQMITQTQMVTQAITQSITQTVTNTVTVSQPKEIASPIRVETNTNKAPTASRPKTREISTREYKQAKKILYQKMRASESIFRRTGSWVDLSFMSSSTYITGASDRLELLGASLSWGRITKGVMFGLSYQYTASDTSSTLRLPSLHEGAFVLGYRIAPDKGIGVRFMFHAGVGSSFSGIATGVSFATPLKYVILMPEIKLDIRLYKSLVFTFGVGYKGMIFLSDSENFQNALASEFGFNTFRGFRYSLGLAFSY